jgi:uncharacterized protein YyaL (SSP411 family)
VVPHFEKMLYDNALLARVYAHLWRRTGSELGRRVAGETCDWMVRELRTPQGGLAASLDADSEGEEGRFYVWSPAELAAVLGPADGAYAAEVFGVSEPGTFEAGRSVLQRRADPAHPERFVTVRAALAAAWERRPRPGRDDKVVAAWNGLAITALAEFACLAWTATEPAEPTESAESADPAPAEEPEPDHCQPIALDKRANQAALRAVRAAELLAEQHLVDGRLRRVSRDGVVGEPAGVLEDYGAVAEAFCAVHQLTGEGRWLELAGQLLDTVLAHFGDGRGGFFDTADDAEALVSRPADPTDNATPAGRSALVAALVNYGALTGEPRYREAAEAALGTVVPIAARHPRFAGYACAVGEALLSGPYEIAVVGGGELAGTAWRLAPPGAVIVSGQPDQPGVPLLQGRPMLDERPTAYVCRGFVCDRPVTTVADLATQLDR